MWQQWINLVLALWIVISAYLNFTPTQMATNLTIVGIAIAILALWGGAEYRAHQSEEHRHRHA